MPTSHKNLTNCHPERSEGSAVRGKMYIPRFARYDNSMNSDARASIISLMSFLRFLMLLSLVVWLGGLIFFAFVLAPTAFSPGLLPTRHLAGSIVGRSLDRLHYIAIVSGIVFLITSMLYS